LFDDHLLPALTIACDLDYSSALPLCFCLLVFDPCLYDYAHSNKACVWQPTIFLKNDSEIKAINCIKEFSSVSGLKMNINKSLLFPLKECNLTELHGIPIKHTVKSPWRLGDMET